MKTCTIQWIDRKGNPTPDNNPAIGMAHVRFVHGDGSVNETAHAICAEHAAQMPAKMSVAWHDDERAQELGTRLIYTSEWRLRSFEDSAIIVKYHGAKVE